jgi:16S rRNA (cytosine1402-N4)-methyltransferase
MTLPEKELARIIYEYGEERNSRRFAAAIVRERYRNPVDTTSRLCEVIESSLPGRDRFAKGKRPQRNRRNPATRVFQALRILVNDEFGALRDGMDGAVKRLAPRGRLGVISFHSLEDRIVKEKFRELAAKNIAEIVTRKPVVANRSEIIDNPRARSAKLRVIEVKP